MTTTTSSWAGEQVAFPPRSGFLALPPRPRRAARASLALYEAVGPRQRLVLAAAGALARAGLAPVLRPSTLPQVDRNWWGVLVRERVEPLTGPVHHVAFRIPGNPRVSALLMDAGGRPLAFAKLLSEPDSPLVRDSGRLLTEVRTQTFYAPAVLDEGQLDGTSYRLQRALPEGRHRPPPHAPAALSQVVDELHDVLSPLCGADEVVCHADLTPRNLRVASDGAWWLFDWDLVRPGPRLADELRFWCAEAAYSWRGDLPTRAARVLQLLRSRGDDEEVRRAVRWPGRVMRTYRPEEHALHELVARGVGIA